MFEKVGQRMAETIMLMKLDIEDLPWVDGRLNVYKLLSCWKEHHDT